MERTKEELINRLRITHQSKVKWNNDAKAWREVAIEFESIDKKYSRACMAIALALENYIAYTNILLTTYAYDKLDQKRVDEDEKRNEEEQVMNVLFDKCGLKVK